MSQSPRDRATLEGRTVLVAGGAGFIGAELIRELVRRGAVAHAAVRRTSSLSRLAEVAQAITVHRVDVRDSTALAGAVQSARPELVVNAVRGRNDGGASRREMVETLLLGTQNLLEAAAAAGCRRFVQLGSSTEYGPSDRPLEEGDAALPSTLFGAAKAAASMLCLAAGRGGPMATVVLRPFMVYGPRDHPSRLVPAAARAALDGSQLPLTPAGYRRDWIFISDVVDGCVRALHGGADGEVVNLGTGVQHSNEDVVHGIERAAGRRLELRLGAMPPRPWDARSWVASTRKARALLGWEARTTLEEGLRRTVAWTRAEIDGGRLAAASPACGAP